MQFGRIITAMITPFDNDGNVDFDTMSVLIEWLLNHGTDGLLIHGTTGESPVISEVEKIDILKHVIKIVNKRVPIIVGTGSNNTEASIAFTRSVSSLDVNGVMLVSPYYNKPNQQGLYAHFKAVANSTTLPVILYNIPSRTNVQIDADTIIKLSEIDNIVALKEATNDLDHVTKVIAKTPAEFTVYSGDDSLTLPMLSIGSEGVISVASHIIGKEMKQMVEAFLRGDIGMARDLHLRLLPVMQSLFQTPSPAPVKAALNWSGIDVGTVRLPLVDMTTEEKSALITVLQQNNVSRFN